MTKFLILIALFFGSFCFFQAHAAVSDSSGKGMTGIDKNILLTLVNKVRQTGCNCGNTFYAKTSPVNWNNKLEQAAQVHSKDMLSQKYFSHIDGGGNDAGTRIIVAGYQWQTYGENIASGAQSEQEVLDGWLRSPGHCRNIMNKNFKEMGVARAGSFWTQIFAAGK